MPKKKVPTVVASSTTLSTNSTVFAKPDNISDKQLHLLLLQYILTITTYTIIHQYRQLHTHYDLDYNPYEWTLTTNMHYIYLDTKLAIKRVQRSCDKRLHTCPPIRRQKNHCTYGRFLVQNSFSRILLRNTPSFKKIFLIKVFKHSIPHQKVSGRICLSPLGGKH